MTPVPLPSDERKRLAALRRYEVLDTLPEAPLDDLTALASAICAAPIALISLVDEERQWFKSRVGMELRETPRDVAFCAHGILEPDLFVIPDALADPRFAENPLVTGETQVRFYAGAPLTSAGGEAIGMLCVMDREPRRLTPEQERALRILSRQVMDQLELRRQTRDLIASESRLLRVFESAPVGVAITRVAGRAFTDVNAAFTSLLGWTADEVIGRNGEDLGLIDAPRSDAFAELLRRDGSFRNEEMTLTTKAGETRECLVGAVRVELRGEPHIISTLEDITQRKRSEARVRQLNRVHAMLSGINEAIVRVRDVPTLLDTACRIAVERGGLRLAWVGLLDESQSRVTLRAHAGADEETIAQVRAVLAAAWASPHGITRRTIESGERVVVNDIASDPRATAWRADALARECRAMATFPLIVDGRTVGVYALNARTAGFFDDEELRLLDELAADLGFALEFEARERRREAAEHEAAEKTELLEKVFANAPLMIALLDADGHVRYANGEFERVTGWTAAELRPQPDLLSVFLPDPDVRESVRAAIWVAERVLHEVRIRARDGRSVTVQFAIVRVNDGTSIGIGIDMSERKRTEHALNESEARFRQLAENIQEVFWMTDPSKQQMLYVSPGYEKIWGRSPESLYEAPATWLDAIHKDDRARVIHAARARQASGEYNELYRITRPDGTVRWIRDRAFPVRDGAGVLQRIVGTATDVTEQVVLEEQLRQSQKMEAIGQLAGGIAHDFNNILAAILMQVELAAEPAGVPEESREFLRDIGEAAERAAHLTRQLLTFSRRQVMHQRRVVVNEAVATLTKMLQRILGEDVRLQLDLHAAALATRADAGMFDQVLLNLVVNARDAMPQGGRLVIESGETDVSADDALAFEGARVGRHVFLRVTDTGVGIAPELMPRIFEPFFTTKEPGRGTGLGLATVFGIVRQHNGSIRVSSEPGRGTSFLVTWPALDSDEPGSGPTAGRLAARGGHETILVVEDEPEVRRLTRVVLERNGYHVLEAPNGRDALRLVETGGAVIDLVLSDVVMPDGLSGIELAAALREAAPSLRVIFTSGYSPEVAGKSIELRPGLDFLQKPIVPDVLLRAVRQALDD